MPTFVLDAEASITALVDHLFEVHGRRSFATEGGMAAARALLDEAISSAR